MLVTITEFQELARDLNGAPLPLGRNAVGIHQFRADGDSGATAEGTKFVRIATDTPVLIGSSDTDASQHQLFMPGVEYVATKGGRGFRVDAA